MNDRELLELAAKALGWAVIGWVDIEPDWGVEEFHGLRLVGGGLWNPLTDDGDALRLAVALNLHMGLEGACANVWAAGMAHWQTVSHDNDPNSATRMAIVKCAASIGKHITQKDAAA